MLGSCKMALCLLLVGSLSIEAFKLGGLLGNKELCDVDDEDEEECFTPSPPPPSPTSTEEEDQVEKKKSGSLLSRLKRKVLTRIFGLKFIYYELDAVGDALVSPRHRLVEGMVLILTCPPAPAPAPVEDSRTAANIRWLNNGVPMDFDFTDQRVVEDALGRLTMSPLLPTDSGHYACTTDSIITGSISIKVMHFVSVFVESSLFFFVAGCVSLSISILLVAYRWMSGRVSEIGTSHDDEYVIGFFQSQLNLTDRQRKISLKSSGTLWEEGGGNEDEEEDEDEDEKQEEEEQLPPLDHTMLSILTQSDQVNWEESQVGFMKKQNKNHQQRQRNRCPR